MNNLTKKLLVIGGVFIGLGGASMLLGNEEEEFEEKDIIDSEIVDEEVIYEEEPEEKDITVEDWGLGLIFFLFWKRGMNNGYLYCVYTFKGR